MDRRSLVAGAFLGAAACAAAAGLLAPAPFRSASAEEPPPLLGGMGSLDPADPTSPGPSINPTTSTAPNRAGSGAGYGMGGANQHAIALSAPIGGESLVYYFDTQQQRLLVYQYQARGDRSGLKLLAARHFDYDLKLEDYGTTPTRTDLKAAYDAAFARSGGRPGEPPPKRVEFPGGR